MRYLSSISSLMSSPVSQSGTIRGLGIVFILGCLWMGLSGLFDLLLGHYTLGASWDRFSIHVQARLGRVLVFVLLVAAIASAAFLRWAF
ncbi:hypothetical protein [Oscillatoria sp. FACHB-1406]|uniref:hypothetical protein n=1 Tax=Oscillatoria sp. FACHB-1406 TaxID=2692846 RepID=UPI001685F02F|nr:hypothetical protein [Oscillatoria sp. FACHB-1406]MBD2577269.1 hypothetical protein [Oscillatoria sp. FACHB-1406]